MLLFGALLLAARAEYGHFPGGPHEGLPHQPVAVALYQAMQYVPGVLVLNIPLWLLLTGTTWWRQEWGRNAWISAGLFGVSLLIWALSLSDGSPLFVRAYYWLFG